MLQLFYDKNIIFERENNNNREKSWQNMTKPFCHSKI